MKLYQRVRDVTITGFRIVGFDDGVFGFGTENLKVSHVAAINNTDYGVASFDGIGTRFTRNATSGSQTLAFMSETQSTPTPWS